MTRVTLSLIVAAGIAAGASPALAQDYTLPPPPPIVYPQGQPAPMPVVTQVQAYPGAPMPAQVRYQTQSQTGPVRQYGYGEPQYAPPEPQPAVHGGLPPVPSVGYTREQRDAWLADCRQQYYGKNARGGGIIGGLLGMIGGGVAGHELTDGSHSRRIGGTILGAGVGGLVGAAIGSAIGAASDRKEMDECEAYLVQYTGGRGPGPLPGPAYAPTYAPGYDYSYPAYTTVMVPVPMQPTYIYTSPTRHETRYVVEDVIEERVVVPHTKYVKTVQPTKYVKRAPTKYTKYAK